MRRVGIDNLQRSPVIDLSNDVYWNIVAITYNWASNADLRNKTPRSDILALSPNVTRSEREGDVGTKFATGKA